MSKFKRDGIVNLLISYSGILLAFFITILKARVLTTEQIGVLSIIVTIAFLAGFFVNLGLNLIIKKFYYHICDDRNKVSALFLSIFTSTLLNGILVSLFLLLFRFQILDRYENQLLSQYYSLVFIIVFAESMNQIWAAIYQVTYRTVLSNIIYDFIFKFSGLVLLFLILAEVINFNSYIYLQVLLYVLRCFLFLIFYLAKDKMVKPDFSILIKSNVKRALSYSFFMFFSGFAGMITKTIDKLMLGAMISVDVVGVYTIILTFPILIQAVGSAFSMTGHAQISELWHKGKKKEINKLYKDNVSIQMLLGLFLFGTFSVFGRPLLHFIGEEYTVALLAFIFLMLGELVNISTGMSGGIIAFSEHYKFDFYTRLSLVGFTVLSNLIFIPLLGLNGAALATSLSLALYNIIKVIFVSVKIGFFPYDWDNVKMIFFSGLFFYILFMFQSRFMINNIVAIIFVSLVNFILYIALNKYLLRLKILGDLKHFLRR